MPDQTAPTFPQSGGCQCGAIRYELREAPFGVWACHCNLCRKQSGSAFGLSMGVGLDTLVFTQGEPATWTRTAESGHVLDCLFCPDCGSRLIHRRHEHGGRQTLKPGTLDDTSWVVPGRHIFTEFALDWVKPLIHEE
ncbi:GFA family protein [Sphingobium nicotianae]|uniref:GFA family protein n=1 Tax=Sphingobium nicotianae TaxID=2782607 RepID=A0A9X1IRX0_9SPHN|nr:GFA family protein [Sphingobium nicotianae]MBT2187812.1 GFA family protein [Sphingobium nicotianae]